jgi:membrane fusion protein (multidrug efflux system)
MFRNQWDARGFRLQVVPTESADWPQGDVGAGVPTATEEQQSISPTAEVADAQTPAPAPTTSPGPALKAPAEAVVAPPVAARKRRVSARRRLTVGALLVAILGSAGWYGYHWLTVGRFTVWTDDAYVQAYNATLAAKVAGYITDVRVTDNMRVRAGDIIATIDDGDYRLAVDSARSKVATQQATITRIGHQIAAQQAAVEQAKTQLVSAKAGATRMQLELERQDMLVTRQASSRQQQEQAQANRDQAVAAVDGAQAAINSAAATVEVLKGQEQEAVSTLDELKATLAKAERDLSFTVIRAPLDGVIGNRAVQAGDYVQTGQRLASLVPLDAVYINANFKETQLARLRPGQTVSIAVDALPEHVIEGTVESFSPASGAVFSLLPPDNATGNFTKIVQRLPVRIKVPAVIAQEGVLRPGMSVVVSVNTKKPTASADSGAPAPVQSAATR